ncbi:HECT E3 ubiquitin ligase [Achlya hypogyna]|uniref:HECT-type E3 ubiquitin transferase n=1 Tax=Achlya hypogyna TaxID=1202772 RepID=A0A1V9ZNN0_ACHHY|nr:HECT E3 ubiquitin ligase [Achlya hypogyna]
MRKQWARQIDADGRVSWKRHFIDSEDFPAAFFVQLNPSQDEVFANHMAEPLDECVVITLRGSIVRGMEDSEEGGRPTEPDRPSAFASEAKSAKAIAWMDLETGDPNKSVLGATIPHTMWTSLLPLTKLAFTLKYAWFLHQTADLFVPYDELYIKTKVSRSRLFEEALENLLHLDGRALCAILRFQFIGESGLDAGAIQREWYMLMAQAMLSEASGMFVITNREDNSYFINPDCAVDMAASSVHYLDAFRAAGRFVGRALLDGQVLPLHFNPVLFKALLGLPFTLDDVETLDRTLYKSLRYLLENRHVDELALTFSVTQLRDGKPIELDLVPHGQDVPVTDGNKHAYVERMMRHLLFERIQDPLHAMIQGLYDIIPPELILVFDHKELELILCGQSDIDLDDWETNTVVSSNLKNSAVLEWFWSIVQSLSLSEQAKLLQYATGSSRVPVQGFQGLTSYDGKICYFTLKGVNYHTGAYPVAHACYNRIDLPLYPTRELLEDAIKTLLLSDPTGFNMQ